MFEDDRVSDIHHLKRREVERLLAPVRMSLERWEQEMEQVALDLMLSFAEHRGMIVWKEILEVVIYHDACEIHAVDHWCSNYSSYGDGCPVLCRADCEGLNLCKRMTWSRHMAEP